MACFLGGETGNAQLLTIMLHTVTRGGSVLGLANKLLTKYGGLSSLVRADFRSLKEL